MDAFDRPIRVLANQLASFWHLLELIPQQELPLVVQVGGSVGGTHD